MGKKTWESILEQKAGEHPERPFLYLVYEDRPVTYAEMDRNANRVANFLLGLGAGPGDGLATLMGNSPQFLDVFFGIQRIGMYINPVNTGLRGEGLAYIIDNCEARYLVVDHDEVDLFQGIRDQTPHIEKVIVNTLEAPSGYRVPKDMIDLRDAYSDSTSTARPEADFPDDSLMFLIYTSGTTGLPKGVVSRYNKNIIDTVRPLAGILLTPESVYYTPLPLFHGNGLFITITASLIVGATVALSKKFSASRFWEEIHASRATHFNTIGAMLPILMKQRESPCEKDNTVKTVLSAGCPASLWEPFEKRFGIQLWEAYAAVDGSGVILNFGNGPKGSLGKPVNSIVRIVDDDGKDVAAGETGELLFKVDRAKKSSVEYFRNPEATEDKTRGEWEHTGDLVYQDTEGYLYFVGRKTDSMRRRGENVSAYEVEKVILKHPAILECAVFGIPSELTEDEIVACVRLVDGMNMTPKDLYAYLQPNLARFAIPRYVRFVNDFPRTETFRIKKNELKSVGITTDTYDLEAFSSGQMKLNQRSGSREQ